MPTRNFVFFTLKGFHPTVAERESTAERLERLGYTRCDYATFKAAWQAEDRARAIKVFGLGLVNPYEIADLADSNGIR